MQYTDTNDEYEEIYEQHKGSGFEFYYNPASRYLSVSKEISKSEVDAIDLKCRNNDDIPLIVRCKRCNQYMQFQEGVKDELDGKWVCQACGAKVNEITIYNQLERENEKFLSDFLDD